MTHSILLSVVWREGQGLPVDFNWRAVFAVLLNITAWIAFARLA